jgi:hypothetical protein
VSNQINIWKDDSTSDHTWYIEVDGASFCEIVKECQDYAHATSRARGTKVEGYRVSFDDGRDAQYFDAANFKSARAALKSAMDFARSEASKGGRA